MSGTHKLEKYLLRQLMAGLESWPSSSDICRTRLAHQLIQEIRDDITSTQVHHKEFNSLLRVKGEEVVGIVRRTPRDVNELLLQSDRVRLLIDENNKRLQLGQSTYLDIVSHHTNLSSSGWEQGIKNDEALRRYGRSAEEMGSRSWVVEANQWMWRTVNSFFNGRGAVKEYIKDVASMTGEYVYVERPLSTRISPVRVLDVGSCYNPLGEMQHQNESSGLKIEVTALDLHPRHPSVHRCDFFSLSDGPPLSPPVFEHSVSSSNSNSVLVRLPLRSYDAVCMSLVLSYLPSAEMRRRMIARAREFLVQPDAPDLSAPSIVTEDRLRYGLLLVVEPFSTLRCYDWLGDAPIADNDGVFSSRTPHGVERTRWRRVIESQGYRFVKSEVLHCSTGKKKAIGMVYRACSIGAQSRHYSTAATPAPVGIVGCGLGGAALACILQHRGIPFYVFEADESLSSRRQGYALTVQQGLTALRTMGVRLPGEVGSGPVLHGCTTTHSHISLTSTGRVLGAFGPPSVVTAVSPDYFGECNDFLLAAEALNDISPAIKTGRGRQNIHIPRQSLRGALMEAFDPSSIRWGHRFATVNRIHAGGLVARFENGESYELSALIGADGVYSRIRQLLLDQRNEENSVTPSNRSVGLNFLGLIVILGISPQEDLCHGLLQEPLLASRRKVQWVDGVTRVFSMPFDERNTLWQLSFPMTEKEILSVKSRDMKSLAFDRCKNWHTPLVRMIENTDENLVTGHPVYDSDPHDLADMRRNDMLVGGSSTPITLLGDSWHPMSPFKAQGANQALLDAQWLGDNMSLWFRCRHQPDVTVASYFQTYEAEAHPRAVKKVLKSRSAAIYLHSPAALTPGNITRAFAAERFIPTQERNVK